MSKCIVCQSEFLFKYGKSFCSSTCRNKARNGFRRVRQEALWRDGFTCKECGKTQEDGAKLQVHHKLSLASGGNHDLSNLESLCASPCHLGRHGKKPRKNVNDGRMLDGCKEGNRDANRAA